MAIPLNANSAGEAPSPFEFTPSGMARKAGALHYWLIPVLICLAHFPVLYYLARQHPLGNFATETDFYHFYAPDAELIANGQFPTNTYQGPGYSAFLALIAKLVDGDLFDIGKWLSVVCAVLCGLLTFIIFARLFSYWVGVGAHLITIVSGEFPQFSINATTDLFFLLLCLVTLAVFTSNWGSVSRRVALSGVLIGLSYLTRYNGLFLLAAGLIGIVILNLFEKNRRERWVLSMIIILTFLVSVSPWLYLNYKHRGSPFYNTNYLNVATEFYPELVAGKTNQDGTRALEQKFHSFGDVLRYDPQNLLLRYPVNLFESLRLSIQNSLVNQLVGWAALFGVVFALFGKRSKAAGFVLIAGAVYLLLMALNHWETRYYFFIMVLYAGLAVYAVSRLSKAVVARSWSWMPPLANITLAAPVAGVFGVVLFAVLWGLSFSESRRDVKRFLAGHPTEVIAALDYLNSVNPQGARLRIVARKPHLPYLSRNEWVFFPQVKSLDEFRVWVENNQVDYIAIGKRELKERKELTSLSDPKNAPPWLKAVWVNDEPMFILYRPKRVGESGSRGVGESEDRRQKTEDRRLIQKL
jgi:hypothetical protein